MIRRGFGEIAAVLLALLFLLPILFALLNSFKTNGEMLRSFVSWPETWELGNYKRVWKDMHYPRALWNTVLVTALGVGFTLLLSAMAAYRISRMNGSRGFWLLMFFTLSMMVPFQTIMIPLVKLASELNLMNSRLGLVLMIVALFSPFTIFLYRGFMTQLPAELEEAARIDGANVYQTFFRIIVPLLLPVTATAAVLNVLWVWNDFILSFLMLQREEVMTLQLTVYRYFGTYSQQWNLALVSLILAAIPVLALYLALQKYIIKGVAAGAVKG
ncbi:carbohydrate ABC transporter permease [Cohnella sp. LGH]|uniref:Carbohydrate ABC transporter membrane protein 2 (CUT1 family) n=1 Tax=Cohnella phaseoli TaxID=456490 RepID=A0A3D9I1D8_9BACL|nr:MULTISPECIES: carbohydrate ABC transporter permease [Cohnella]QTH41754.1 carbohydrate ABC transporter permease [Cohnella sp. LGH]RED55582.1 carbohydrate ABC transporter membrane protein 2 (CUT1 family) [Cohnella phaseoli]